MNQPTPGPVVGRPVLGQQSRMAVRNLQHAARFAIACEMIEQDTADLGFAESRYEELEANVVAGIFLSVASMEANLHELLEDNPRFGLSLSDDAFNEIWKNGDRKPMLAKFQFVLTLMGKSKMPEGEKVFHAAGLLVQLRNVFVHFRPINDSEVTKPAQGLKGKFRPNRFFATDEQLVPQGCVSHSCLEWAVATSLAFTREFVCRSGLRSNFILQRDSDFKTSTV